MKDKGRNPCANSCRFLCAFLLSVISLLCLSLPIRQAGAAPAMDGKVTVYYFHHTVRCDTCLMIEALAEMTLRAEFPSEISDGTLAWRTLDVQQTENRHFVTDFALHANELVVVRENAGEKTSWKKIPEIWELASDPEQLCLRIKDVVSGFLGKIVKTVYAGDGVKA